MGVSLSTAAVSVLLLVVMWKWLKIKPLHMVIGIVTGLMIATTAIGPTITHGVTDGAAWLNTKVTGMVQGQ